MRLPECRASGVDGRMDERGSTRLTRVESGASDEAADADQVKISATPRADRTGSLMGCSAVAEHVCPPWVPWESPRDQDREDSDRRLFAPIAERPQRWRFAAARKVHRARQGPGSGKATRVRRETRAVGAP
jgi:hypothetical protein